MDFLILPDRDSHNSHPPKIRFSVAPGGSSVQIEVDGRELRFSRADMLDVFESMERRHAAAPLV